MLIIVVVVMLIIVVVVMLIIVVVVMLTFTMLIESQGLDAIGGNDQAAVEPGSFDQPLHPAFKLKTVDDQHIRLAELAGIGWAWGEDVRVPVWTHERRDLSLVTCNLLHHVFEDGEGRYDLQLLGLSLRQRAETEASSRSAQD